jgi:hypothetical protein
MNQGDLKVPFFPSPVLEREEKVGTPHTPARENPAPLQLTPKGDTPWNPARLDLSIALEMNLWVTGL